MEMYDGLEIDRTDGPITPERVMVRALKSADSWAVFAGFCNRVMRTKQDHERALDRGDFEQGDPLLDIAQLLIYWLVDFNLV